MAFMSILFLVTTVSAADFRNVDVFIEGINANDDPGIITGETVTIEVFFTSNIDDSGIKVKVEIEGEEIDIDSVTSSFEVESGQRYRKILTLRVPHELEDEVSDDATLNLKIWGGDADTFRDDFDLRVQRQSFDVEFMSISTSQTVEAGKLLPVNVVLKNIGYNDLDDLFVTVRISELDIERTAYFGDLIAIEDNDEDDVVSGRIFLEIPFEVKSGVYTLDVEAKSDNLRLNKVKEIVIENGFSSNVIVSGNRILIANPTNKLMILKLIPESSGDVLVSLSEDLLVIPAGSSRTVTATATGSQEYNINIFSKEGDLIHTVTLSATEKTGGNAIAILTVILTIIFLVLLVVLIVLITKKPEKAEDLGESYY